MNRFSPSRCETVAVRGLRYNVRRWGPDGARPILFLHGTQDSSVTFQFVVDALKGDWSVIAPDWRGHGHSERTSQGYWFHEFVADLDVLVDRFFPDTPAPIVGHSLGGNIASAFAGVRPDRVSRLISLDGFGPLVNRVPVDMLQLLTRFLAIPRERREHAGYAGIEEAAARLRGANPRLAPGRARFLAEHSTAACADGRYRWLFDPSHQTALPSLHTMEEWARIWSVITAPALWVASSDPRPHSPMSLPGEIERRAAMLPGVGRVTLADTGHNLHHDEPERVGALIERFVADPQATLPKNGTATTGSDGNQNSCREAALRKQAIAFRVLHLARFTPHF